MSIHPPSSKPVFIRLSGGVRAEVNGEIRAEIGTARNRSLLALLAMRMGSLTTRETAIDLVWPDADPDAGRNRLSTALVFLRKLLGSDGQNGQVLLSNQTHLWLNPDTCSVDVLEIERAFETVDPADSPVQVLEESFRLFQGALAPEVYDDWIAMDQVRFSEIIDSIAKHLIERQVAQGRHEAARRTLYKYRKLGEPMEPDGWHDHVPSLTQGSPVEINLDISFGRLDSTKMDLGALSPNSPLYVERETDEVFHQALRDGESIVLVKGPRQIGKTSLIARGVKSVGEGAARCVFTDFQKFPSSLMNDEGGFYLALAYSIGRQVGFDYDFDRNWRPAFGAGMNLEYFIRDTVDRSPGPLVWFIDEGDKLFGSAFASDFYGLIRSFHNSRAIDVDGSLSRLTIVVSYATEAYLFIKDLNQSPFNVGRRIFLEDFTVPQVDSLNQRLARPLSSLAEVEDLVMLVGGHPFLVRRSMNLIQQGWSLAALSERAHHRDGPFADHLNRILASLTHSAESTQCIQAILNGDRPPAGNSLQRLISAGVVKTTAGHKLEIRNMLYRRFLLSALNDAGE